MPLHHPRNACAIDTHAQAAPSVMGGPTKFSDPGYATDQLSHKQTQWQATHALSPALIKCISTCVIVLRCHS